MKIDLHVHSRHSKTPSDWVLRKLGAQESYTDPIDVYRIAKNRGMDAVTITDHNTIGGCLEIAYLSDTFISCEYTTYFPPDNCKLHVVCYNITPEDHERIQGLRANIFELVAYLKDRGIPHTLAHALFSPDAKLTPEHFDQLLQMFDTWEINGAKDEWVNEYLQTILGLQKPGCKLTAGSDDHSSLTIAGTWTEVPGANSVKEFFEGLGAGRATVSETHCSPYELAWNIYSVGWQWLYESEVADGLAQTVNRYLLPPERAGHPSLARKIRVGVKAVDPRNWPRIAAMALAKRQIQKLNDHSSSELPLSWQWLHLMEGLTSKYLAKVGSTIVDGVVHRKFYNVFSYLGIPIALYSLLAPFVAAFASFSGQRRLSGEVLHHYVPSHVIPMKVVKFTDTFGSVDGVSRTLAEQLKEAHRSGKDYTIVSCAGGDGVPGHKHFQPVGMISAPEYEGQKLCWPPLLKMLEYCYHNQFTLIQASTPGPVGLAGLVIARVLGLPFQAVYHTQIPEFIGKATGERFVEAAARKYCMWFYDSADKVFAPSEHTRSHLIQQGIRQEKITVYPRGTNAVFFHPSKRSNYWAEKWGVPVESVKGLFVGRVSREKDVPLLVRVFKELADKLKKDADPAASPRVTLLAVGAGAYEDEMKRECQGYPVVLTGELEGEELATAFASADFFVFPSTTDTFGRVVLEAMASGLPCIVSDTGGPQESILHGVNGLVFKSNDGKSLKDAIMKLALDPGRREMGAKAREAAEQRSFSEAFERLWKLYS
jgi:glycosyltransferase involved in cell wall biosynthesis/predicted metal-dependent phosphoesterase TrpH